MLFPSLNKKQLTISILLTHNSCFLLFKFKKRRTKFLKYQRTFYAKVYTGKLTVAETLDCIRAWLESITEDYLLEKLEDSPAKYRPIFKIAEGVRIDFNVLPEELPTVETMPF